MLILAVSHNIHLTKKERYALADGETVEVIGSNIPVWFYNFNTSEPAAEIFCKYIIHNAKGESYISAIKDGYEINIPQLPENYMEPPTISDEEWRKMSLPEQQEWYAKHPVPPTGKDLLDLTDGGSSHMRFQHEVMSKWRKYRVKHIHQAEINDIEKLKQSLV
jgi:hypothetical protein